jgi:hypothetical protein
MMNNTQVSAVIRFATREEGVSFSSHPDKINAQLYVHENGDIHRLGVSIAKSLTNYENKVSITCEIDNLDWLVENRIDYIYDIDYIYYIWQAKGKSTWISIFETGIDYTDEACPTCGSPGYGEPIYKDKCVFVGTPEELPQDIIDGNILNSPIISY